MERFRLALALPEARARIGGLWRPRPRRGHEAVPAAAVARRRGARFSERSGVIRAKRGPGAADRLLFTIWHLSEAEEWVNQMRRLPL
jgi:hypothetical protein